MLGFDNELDRLEFMIALTERANNDGYFDAQLDRLLIKFVEELTSITYEEAENE